jgi:hypothetical protein
VMKVERGRASGILGHGATNDRLPPSQLRVSERDRNSQF